MCLFIMEYIYIYNFLLKKLKKRISKKEKIKKHKHKPTRTHLNKEKKTNKTKMETYVNNQFLVHPTLSSLSLTCGPHSLFLGHLASVGSFFPLHQLLCPLESDAHAAFVPSRTQPRPTGPTFPATVCLSIMSHKLMQHYFFPLPRLMAFKAIQACAEPVPLPIDATVFFLSIVSRGS